MWTDDKTPLAIKNTGADIVSYGAPVLPGAMFMLAYYQVTGRKSKNCSYYGTSWLRYVCKEDYFDLVLQRVMADDQVTAEELAALGQGGLCLNCPVCTFPNCGFGRSVIEMEFTHFDENGNALMVDVSEKSRTKREATARGSIYMSPECLKKVKERDYGKGRCIRSCQSSRYHGC